jgi:uncharacterized protein (DUF1330 family)
MDACLQRDTTMLYLVAGQTPNSSILLEPRRIVAQGEMAVLEGPWDLGASVIVRVDDAAIEYIGWSAKTLNLKGYAVEAQVDPGAGEAFVIGAHCMRDPEGFRPYAEQVAAVVQSFGGRFLARGGKVTPIGGDFVPDRAVIIEFPTATDAVGFYCSDAYAPLLKIRHATTDPRFVLLARAGALPAEARAAAEKHLRSRPASSH